MTKERGKHNLVFVLMIMIMLVLGRIGISVVSHRGYSEMLAPNQPSKKTDAAGHSR